MTWYHVPGCWHGAAKIQYDHCCTLNEIEKMLLDNENDFEHMVRGNLAVSNAHENH